MPANYLSNPSSSAQNLEHLLPRTRSFTLTRTRHGTSLRFPKPKSQHATDAGPGTATCVPRRPLTFFLTLKLDKPWDFRILSSNLLASRITLADVVAHPELPWDADGLSMWRGDADWFRCEDHHRQT
jgi:hypothetical protein